RLHAFLAGATEAGAGLLLPPGFLTPLAAAGLIAGMIVAPLSVHWENGVLGAKKGYEYPFLIAAAPPAPPFPRPGRPSPGALPRAGPSVRGRAPRPRPRRLDLGPRRPRRRLRRWDRPPHDARPEPRSFRPLITPYRSPPRTLRSCCPDRRR